MEEKYIPLSMLPIGKTGMVKRLTCCGNLRRRMLDLGLIKDAKVEALQRSPFGDPTAYEIRGAVMALRSEESSHILVEAI